jgi:hypothetical protein
MDPAQQLNTILISLVSWSTVTTVGIILARRDFKLGLQKWFYLKFRKQPLKIRYHGPDKNVVSMVIPMKGKGETIKLFDKKLFFLKTGDGMMFLVDEASLRRCDDGINELSYSYKSVMPIDPTKTKEEVRQELQEFLKRRKDDEKSVVQREGIAPIEMDELTRYTDPRRLNKLVDYVYLAAKADALAAATDVEKWVKYTAIGVGVTILGVIAIYYTLDGKVIPFLQTIGAQVASVGSQVLSLG